MFSHLIRCVNSVKLLTMEKPGSSMGPESVEEFEDRDPNNLNQHLQVCFWTSMFSKYQSNI